MITEAETMLEERVRTIRDYAETVFYRGRVPMEPLNFQPNWRDQPSKHKTYLGVPRLPLPVGLPELGPVSSALGGHATGRASWTLDSVSALLRLSYGLLDRRLRIGWNQDIDTRVNYQDALWGRATASGGGMYPLETYWVSGGSGPLTPGVYHYSTAHHGLERLLTGDVTGRVREALGEDPGTDQFLLVSVRFWKNSYKYNSFCYHVVTQDAGAMLGSWELVARGLGRPLHRALWFADEPLNELLGLRTLDESVLAVVPLPWNGGGPARPAGVGRPAGRPFFERSAEILRFEQVERAHLATLLSAGQVRPRPAAAAGSAVVPAPLSGGTHLRLPPPAPGDGDLGGVLRRRRSSFGAFTARPALSLEELGTVLAGASSAQRYSADVKCADAPLTRLYVLANRVDGLAPGTYAYETGGHRLRTIEEREVGTFLQKAYYLTNYNLDQVSAVVAIAANLDSGLRLYGGRGYRVLNSEVGAVAQTAYVAACAAGVGCGAVLGFDNIAIDESVGLDRTDERTFLFLLLGHERTDPADFDYRLV
ncbi:SagB family peptide dehydrogenase [Actinomadura sp. DC4]|uniref:SagB family peptide dehydrogenase n=1 Tax=Actinomadura sp. DC4 TaxID=3055069 RepID=UPI0025AED2AA|nr:SagB family peptide dehydrogenase [Actinomadura sp. DC4]MDN3352022.1 SagB family peptide dehydrogenase [Actinomadura sp. DC4]